MLLEKKAVKQNKKNTKAITKQQQEPLKIRQNKTNTQKLLKCNSLAF